jgi:hypothetical protein
MRSDQRRTKNRFKVRTSLRRLGAAIVTVLLLAPLARGYAAEPSPLQSIETVSDEPFLQEYREPFVAWEQPVENSAVAISLDDTC